MGPGLVAGLKGEGRDPFDLNQPDPLGFGGPGQGSLAPPVGFDDPFGLQSGVQQGFGGPGGFGDPAQGGFGGNFSADGDLFGLVSGIAGAPPQAPQRGGLPAAGSDLFKSSQLDAFRPAAGGAKGNPFQLPPPNAAPSRGASKAPPPKAPSFENMEDSAEEEPLDPMEALKLLETLTGSPMSAPSATAKKPAARGNADPFNLDSEDSLELDSGLDDTGRDDFGRSEEPLSLGADPFGLGGGLGSGPGGGFSLDPPSGLNLDDLGGAGSSFALPPDLGGNFGGDLALGSDSGELDLPPDLGGDPFNLGDNDLALPPDLGGGPSLASLGELELPPEPKAKSAGKAAKPGPKKKKGGEEEDKSFGVVVSGLGLKSKREVAIQIIMEITGLSESEAEDLCSNPVVPVLKGVSKEEADAAMERFKAAKINCRINARRDRRKR